jgi:hypothetical protein
MSEHQTWTPPNPGKGAILRDGSVVTWNYNGHLDDAIHAEVLHGMGIPISDTTFTFYIEPDSTVYAMDEEASFEDMERLRGLGLDVQTLEPEEAWEFEAAWRTASSKHLLNWTGGTEGKGIVGEYGTVHTWDDDEYDLHDDYLRDAGLWPKDERAYTRFLINHDGRVNNSGLGVLPPTVVSRITEADPHLYYTPHTLPNDWEFSDE